MNVCSRESNSMQVWLMMREVCCLGRRLLKRIHTAGCGTLSNESQAGSRQRQRKGLSLARKWLRVVKYGGASAFLAYAKAWLLPGMSPPSLPFSLKHQQQSWLFGASFSALWPHSSFSSASPRAAKAAAWSGLLLTFFTRQNSDGPYLPRSPEPGWRQLQNQSSSSSSMRAKILLAWIISLRMQP